MSSPSPDARQALVATLRRQVEKLEGSPLPAEDTPLSTGVRALDRLLPGGGLRRGSLVEYLTPGAGSGAGTLALSAAREACAAGGRAFVVLDWRREFYPPAAGNWGIDLARLIVLRPRNHADALWALDQALRCPGVGAVWAACDRLDVRDFRRLQLAAESGRTLGILLRPARLRGQPTWAEVRWLVTPLVASSRSRKSRGWQLRVELVRAPGGAGGQVVHLELDEPAGVWREASEHAAHPLHLPAELADPAAARRA